MMSVEWSLSTTISLDHRTYDQIGYAQFQWHQTIEDDICSDSQEWNDKAIQSGRSEQTPTSTQSVLTKL